MTTRRHDGGIAHIHVDGERHARQAAEDEDDHEADDEQHRWGWR
jgi:hypothetical protein